MARETLTLSQTVKSDREHYMLIKSQFRRRYNKKIQTEHSNRRLKYMKIPQIYEANSDRTKRERGSSIIIVEVLNVPLLIMDGIPR